MIEDFDISDLNIVEYPWIDGVFYTYEVNEQLPLDERVAEEVEVLRTIFDAQRAAKLHNGSANGADYTIYWPLELNPESEGSWDKYMPIPVRRGMRFRGIAWGVLIEGEVEIVRPSQLGGCSCDVKVITESEY